MNKLIQFINNCLTEKDNQTFNLQKTLYAFIVISYVGLSIVDVIRTKEFEYQPFAIGGASLLGAGGAGIYFQSNSEAKKEDKPNE